MLHSKGSFLKPGRFKLFKIPAKVVFFFLSLYTLYHVAKLAKHQLYTRVLFLNTTNILSRVLTTLVVWLVLFRLRLPVSQWLTPQIQDGDRFIYNNNCRKIYNNITGDCRVKLSLRCAYIALKFFYFIILLSIIWWTSFSLNKLKYIFDYHYSLGFFLYFSYLLNLKKYLTASIFGSRCSLCIKNLILIYLWAII